VRPPYSLWNTFYKPIWSHNPSVVHCRLASTNESIIRVLLGVAPIQASIISFLLVKLLDYELNEDDSVEQNIPRMILAQIKWLERVVDPPKLADGIIETLAAASVPVKKEIIGILPEILDDESSGKEVVRVLVEELERGGQLVPVVLDSLSTMQLDSDSSVRIASV
jgi:Fanconi anemia group D2 protein